MPVLTKPRRPKGCGPRAAAQLVANVKRWSNEPDHLPPDIHFFTASEQAWVILAPGTPAIPEHYEPGGTVNVASPGTPLPAHRKLDRVLMFAWFNG